MASVLPPQKAQETYTFSSQPKAVRERKKYRDPYQDENQPAAYGNIMYDKRVIRGNTYALQHLPATSQPDPVEVQRQNEAKKRARARARAKQQLRPRTPDAVEGRKHMDVQTELYLEEISDRVEEADQEVQTDAFLDRPPTPLFVPAKTGKDVATQILEGELFDFDIEVQPILEVLVGKTVEQSLLEVLEEEELASLREQQRAFEELRNAELVEQQRLEEQERRHREEKERRMKQQREILRKEKETADKIAARAFAQSYLADLIPSVFGTLADNGYFYDPIERDVEQGFLPWLMDRVAEKMDNSTHSRMVLDGLVREVVRNRVQAFKKLDDSKKAAKAPLVPKEAEGEADEPVAEVAPAAEPQEAAPTEAAPEEETTGPVEEDQQEEEEAEAEQE
ncbi:DgyrCDS13946 [Dimorphilus gyrociliatus]|uniref:DgyrCDS13946 n=1 Tax=Dimorphilus gyrociliatus TaxID=2664684 RepID=A0A7I8WC43_9ANNE|nr:DgyrCDS13946 [Dimorphilus gyrociliatus]